MNSMDQGGSDDEDVADIEMKRDLASVERRDSKSPCSPLVDQRWQTTCTAQNDADLERPCSPPVRNTRPSVGKQSKLIGSVLEVSLLEFSPSSIRPGSSGEQQVHLHSEGSPTEDNDAILSSSQDEEVLAWFNNDEDIELDLKGRLEPKPHCSPLDKKTSQHDPPSTLNQSTQHPLGCPATTLTHVQWHKPNDNPRKATSLAFLVKFNGSPKPARTNGSKQRTPILQHLPRGRQLHEVTYDELPHRLRHKNNRRQRRS
ncbi:unnamed protein product [Aphanomyces euteiches]